jgi:hypothetical protein
MPTAAENETLLLKRPTVSAEHLTFLYPGDIRIAGRGGMPRILRYGPTVSGKR